MKMKNNEVGMVSDYKSLILRSEFVETRFWRALPDCKPTKYGDLVYLIFLND